MTRSTFTTFLVDFDPDTTGTSILRALETSKILRDGVDLEDLLDVPPKVKTCSVCDRPVDACAKDRRGCTP